MSTSKPAREIIAQSICDNSAPVSLLLQDTQRYELADQILGDLFEGGYQVLTTEEFRELAVKQDEA